MLAALPLGEALRQARAVRLMGWDELRSVQTPRFRQAICLVWQEGRKFGYSSRTKEEYQQARQMLSDRRRG
ncbi:MAG: hypothetical protein ACOX8W_02680 [bacterium]|jgi:hypothetical protein